MIKPEDIILKSAVKFQIDSMESDSFLVPSKCESLKLSYMIWDHLKVFGGLKKPDLALPYIWKCPCCHYIQERLLKMNISFFDGSVDSVCKPYCPIKWDWNLHDQLVDPKLQSEDNYCHSLFWMWHEGISNENRAMVAHEIKNIIDKSL